MCLLGKGHAGFALDLKFLTLDLCRIIRRKVDSCCRSLSLLCCFCADRETDSGGGTKILKCSYIPVKDGQFRVEHDDNGLNITGHEDVDSDSVFIEFRNSSGHLLTKQEVSVHNQSLVSYVREFEEDGTLKATSMWVERKVDESGNEEGSN